MSSNAINYFKKTILKYNKGDIETILSKELKCAGPLLTMVLNGIDLIGGMCCGFGPGNSRARFVWFMENYMSINKIVAELLYSCVRCGMTHQGMPKIGIKFFVWPNKIKDGKILYINDKDCYLWLNVTQLAYLYLDTIDKIALEPEKHINYYPSLEEKDETTYLNAKIIINDNIQDFFNDEDVYDKMRELEGCQPEGSLSAYTPDSDLTILEEIPPENNNACCV